MKESDHMDPNYDEILSELAEDGYDVPTEDDPAHQMLVEAISRAFKTGRRSAA